MGKENGAVPKDLPAIFMMESTRKTANMALVASSGLVVTNTKASISKTIDTGTERCAGLMAPGTKENGIEASNTAMGR